MVIISEYSLPNAEEHYSYLALQKNFREKTQIFVLKILIKLES